MPSLVSSSSKGLAAHGCSRYRSAMDVIPAISVEYLALKVGRRNHRNRTQLTQNQRIRMLAKRRRPAIGKTASYSRQSPDERAHSCYQQEESTRSRVVP